MIGEDAVESVDKQGASQRIAKGGRVGCGGIGNEYVGILIGSVGLVVGPVVSLWGRAGSGTTVGLNK